MIAAKHLQNIPTQYLQPTIRIDTSTIGIQEKQAAFRRWLILLANLNARV